MTVELDIPACATYTPRARQRTTDVVGSQPSINNTVARHSNQLLFLRLITASLHCFRNPSDALSE